jgi:hypothetical protein
MAAARGPWVKWWWATGGGHTPVRVELERASPPTVGTTSLVGAPDDTVLRGRRAEMEPLWVIFAIAIVTVAVIAWKTFEGRR